MATPSIFTREAGTSTAKHRPARRRLSPSHVLIGLVALLAGVFNYLALQGREATTPVAVAATDIGAGTTFTAELVRLVPIASDFAGLDHLLDEPGLARFDGWMVARPLATGEPVTLSDLVPAGPGNGAMTMSIPVPVEHAVGGILTVGDRIDVLAVVEGTAEFVARGLEVMAVADTQSGGLAGSTPYHLVVAVTADEALSLAVAIDRGSFEVLRSTGADPAGPG